MERYGSRRSPTEPYEALRLRGRVSERVRGRISGRVSERIRGCVSGLSCKISWRCWHTSILPLIFTVRPLSCPLSVPAKRPLSVPTIFW